MDQLLDNILIKNIMAYTAYDTNNPLSDNQFKLCWLGNEEKTKKAHKNGPCQYCSCPCRHTYKTCPNGICKSKKCKNTTPHKKQNCEVYCFLCNKYDHNRKECYNSRCLNPECANKHSVLDCNLLPCNNCNIMGHTRRHCPQLPCSHCNVYGHTKKYCEQLPCSNCKKNGHIIIDCKSLVCNFCKGHDHTTESCRVRFNQKQENSHRCEECHECHETYLHQKCHNKQGDVCGKCDIPKHLHFSGKLDVCDPCTICGEYTHYKGYHEKCCYCNSYGHNEANCSELQSEWAYWMI